MKTLSLLIALFGLSACFATNNNASEDGVKHMKQYSSIEQLRCPKSRYHSVGKRLECKHEVRAELNAKLEEKEAKENETN